MISFVKYVRNHKLFIAGNFYLSLKFLSNYEFVAQFFDIDSPQKTCDLKGTIKWWQIYYNIIMLFVFKSAFFLLRVLQIISLLHVTTS